MKLNQLKGWPREKFVNKFNLSPNPDIINDCEVKRQGFNQALKSLGEMELELDEGKLATWIDNWVGEWESVKENLGDCQPWNYVSEQIASSLKDLLR